MQALMGFVSYLPAIPTRTQNSSEFPGFAPFPCVKAEGLELVLAASIGLNWDNGW